MGDNSNESILKAFKGAALGSSDVDSMLSGRFYFHDGGERPVKPYAVYTLENSEIERTHSGQGGVERLDVQVSIYAKTPTEALRIRDALVAQLKGYKGTVDETYLNSVFFEGESSFEDEQGKTFGYLLDFRIYA